MKKHKVTGYELEYVNKWNDYNSTRNFNSINFNGIELNIDNSVFCPDQRTTNSTSIIINNLPDMVNKEVLDIGTGTGVLAIESALRGAQHIIATDISKNCLEIANRNISKYNLQSKIHLVESNLFQNINNKFDIILANLPIDLQSKFWSGVKSNLPYDFLSNVTNYLNNEGVALFPYASFSDQQYILETAENLKLNYSKIEEEKLGIVWNLLVIKN